MALTPDNDTVFLDDLLAQEQEAEDTLEPSKTYRLDIENGRIGGLIDGEEALRQFITKAIMTARNRYIAYDEDYGCEIHDLLGENITRNLLEAEIPRVLKDAVEYDDRIERLRIDELRTEKDAVYVVVTAFTSELWEAEEVTVEIAI